MTSFLADTTDLLARTPRVLQALLAGLSDAWTDTPDVTGGWRPRDVVGHFLEDFQFAGATLGVEQGDTANGGEMPE